MSKKLHKNGDSNIWERIGGRSGGTVASLVASSGDAGDRRIWAGTMAGVFFSNDEGKSWSISNSGLTSPFIQAMGVSPDYDNDGNLFAIFIVLFEFYFELPRYPKLESKLKKNSHSVFLTKYILSFTNFSILGEFIF